MVGKFDLRNALADELYQSFCGIKSVLGTGAREDVYKAFQDYVERRIEPLLQAHYEEHREKLERLFMKQISQPVPPGENDWCEGELSRRGWELFKKVGEELKFK